MADHEKNHDQGDETRANLYTIPAEPLGAGAHPTITPGCHANPNVKKRKLTPAEVTEAIVTKL
ncbi:MAG: hypothetical protein HGA33_05355 [Candidatus Moranbacteria bacterium]|nr:hypothetical protein [Candidatus Moranbacteria bacterium]